MPLNGLLPAGVQGANKSIDYPIERFAPFGDLAMDFKKQGWQPERWNNEFTEYRPSYGMLNKVELNDLTKGKGTLSIRMGNKNGLADLFVKDENGNMVGEPIMQGVSPKQLNNYFTNTTSPDNYGNPTGSVINQRINNLGAVSSLF